MALHDPYALAHNAGHGSRSPSPLLRQHDPNLASRSSSSNHISHGNPNGQPPLESSQSKPDQMWRQVDPSKDNAGSHASSSNKRKHDNLDSQDDHMSKTPRLIQPQETAHVMPMTTVICLHAAVAQKSYGSEKRFLCPPPVVHVEGPVWHMRTQQLTMAVMSESGERSFEQRAPLDNTMTANFKALHVTGTSKSKNFSLSLEIAQPAVGNHPSDSPDAPAGRIWASFDSAPVSIISKPSKKTAKTRNITSTILAGGPVSLFNRINSQTVRTKYMTIEHAQLCASNINWSAFNVNVVRRESDPPNIMEHFAGPQAVTYGSEIILSDTQSGISTSPLIIRKVDKGRISDEDGGPVSQMQKVALQRMNADGSRHYLSAAGPVPGTPGMMTIPAPSASQNGTHPLLFQSPRVKEEVGKDNIRRQVDEVDDYLCWTIVGISKFQYTFFDTSGRPNNIPEVPITPFPTLFSAPMYRQGNNTVELTVSNFFYENPISKMLMPMDVFLGNLGPLRHRVYQPTSVGGLTNGGGGGPQFAGNVYTIVIVEMPPVKDVMKALEEDALPPPSEAPPDEPTGAPNIAGRSLPLLFIRASDGVGYHSGRTITCESIFPSMGMPPPNVPNLDAAWLAQAAADGANNLNYTLRVL